MAFEMLAMRLATSCWVTVYVDSENNNIEQYVNKECHPLNKRHDEIAIPIVVQLSTGIPYSLFVSKTEQILILSNSTTQSHFVYLMLGISNTVNFMIIYPLSLALTFIRKI